MLRSSRKNDTLHPNSAVLRPPLGRRPELGGQELLDLALGGKPGEQRLAENLLAVDLDVENATATRLQLDAAENRGPLVHDLLSQAHGPVEIVSRNAEFNCDLGFGNGHLVCRLLLEKKNGGAIPMSTKRSPIMVVACACGQLLRGPIEELVGIVQKHARESHNMQVTREDVLSRARPEA